MKKEMKAHFSNDISCLFTSESQVLTSFSSNELLRKLLALCNFPLKSNDSQYTVLPVYFIHLKLFMGWSAANQNGFGQA